MARFSSLFFLSGFAAFISSSTADVLLDVEFAGPSCSDVSATVFPGTSLGNPVDVAGEAGKIECTFGGGIKVSNVTPNPIPTSAPSNTGAECQDAVKILFDGSNGHPDLEFYDLGGSTYNTGSLGANRYGPNSVTLPNVTFIAYIKALTTDFDTTDHFYFNEKAWAIASLGVDVAEQKSDKVALTLYIAYSNSTNIWKLGLRGTVVSDPFATNANFELAPRFYETDLGANPDILDGQLRKVAVTLDLVPDFDQQKSKATVNFYTDDDDDNSNIMVAATPVVEEDVDYYDNSYATFPPVNQQYPRTWGLDDGKQNVAIRFGADGTDNMNIQQGSSFESAEFGLNTYETAKQHMFTFPGTIRKMIIRNDVQTKTEVEAEDVPNSPPTFDDIEVTITEDADAAGQVINAVINTVDVESNNLFVIVNPLSGTGGVLTLQQGPTKTTVTQAMSFDPTVGLLKFEPTADYFSAQDCSVGGAAAAATFEYFVIDGNIEGCTADESAKVNCPVPKRYPAKTVSVCVESVNDIPETVSDTHEVVEGSTAAKISLNTSDPDLSNVISTTPSHEPTTISITALTANFGELYTCSSSDCTTTSKTNCNLITLPRGPITLTGGEEIVCYYPLSGNSYPSPVGDVLGSDSFDFTITDGGGLSTTSTKTVNILNGVTANDGTSYFTEGVTGLISLSGADSQAIPRDLKFTITAFSGNGVLYTTDPSLPNPVVYVLNTELASATSTTAEIYFKPDEDFINANNAGTAFLDQDGNVLGGCASPTSCPVMITYIATPYNGAAVDGSSSGPGTIDIFVQNQNDVIGLVAPESVTLARGEFFKFTGDNTVLLDDKDSNLEIMKIQITFEDEVVGSLRMPDLDVNQANLFEPADSALIGCLDTNGCGSPIRFKASVQTIQNALNTMELVSTAEGELVEQFLDVKIFEQVNDNIAAAEKDIKLVLTEPDEDDSEWGLAMIAGVAAGGVVVLGSVMALAVAVVSRKKKKKSLGRAYEDNKDSKLSPGEPQDMKRKSTAAEMQVVDENIFDWEKHIDKKTGEVYFFNAKTGVSQWDAPTVKAKTKK